MILDRFRMDGRVAIVTGGGRGIGEGAALAMAEMGADVVLAARTPEQLEIVAEKVRGLGQRALAVPCDVNEREQIENVVNRAVEEFGRIDVLVNNAGGSAPAPALRTSEKMFETALRFNVTTAFLMSRLVIPHMQAGEGGSIVNISSAAGRMPQANFVAYGTAKAALTFMTKQLAAEFAPTVRVNAIEVGATATSALMPFLDEETQRQMEQATPMKRIGTVEDISIAALYLASPASSWVTGRVLAVDGGTESSNWPF
jgi:7-alpha-hydroxysteroid dehydrogenase